MKHRIYESPVGEYVLVVDDDGALAGIYRAGQGHVGAVGERDDAVAADAAAQLDEYFAGTRRDFDLPLAPLGSSFQHAVWHAIADIPFGSTRSYGSIAAELGSSARAVGGATGRNPLSIVVPCHRVMAADGTLHGYGGGLETKAWLLRHEGVAYRAGAAESALFATA